VKRLREGDRKLGRVRQVASELTKTPAIIITEELGERPQDEMISDLESGGLRHRIKQTPFKALEKAVKDKALERGSKIFRVSSYRNSRVCPIHFVRLERTDDWHTLKCPLGHYVDRDHASVMNMNWKLTTRSMDKGRVVEFKEWHTLKCPLGHYVDRDHASVMNMNWRKHENKSNPIIPYTTVQHLHAMLKTFTASLEKSPAVLARGKPMNPAGGADEGWARKPPKKGGGQKNLIGVETNSPCLMNLEPTEHSQ